VTQQELVAERSLVARPCGGGDDLPFRIAIYRPRWTQEGVEAACFAEVQGLPFPAGDIFGIDLIDALENALRFTNRVVEGLRDRYVVYWPDGEPFEAGSTQ
jgi:hypothetical protein